MIPKIIHYVWFGGAPLSPLAEKCIASWKRHCPDYAIVRWDESNFDFRANRYCSEAYGAKKWAFASDYARLWILVNHGGIYMDTDVEVVRSLDGFLGESSFSGFEAEDKVPTGIMACDKGNAFFAHLLEEYENRPFVLEDGSFDLSTNVEVITRTCAGKGLVLDGTKQTIEGFTLYPSDYFCPKDFSTGALRLTDNTCAIHHFDGSWLDEETLEFLRIRRNILSRGKRIPPKIATAFAVASQCLKQRSVSPLIRKMRDSHK